MIESPKILAVDSSTLAGSVALSQGETLVAECLLNVRRTHSEKLLGQIDLLLAEADWQLADLDLLVAVTGPGSFTGLRIGVATVKGLAQVIDIPVVGISSLEMLALNLPLSPVPVGVFLDARKKEVYTQLFDCGQDGPVPRGDARVLPPTAALQQMPEQVALVGDGVPLYRDLILATLGDSVLLPPVSAHQPRAAQAAWLGLREYRKNGGSAAAELLPTYIRPSDAELNLAKS